MASSKDSAAIAWTLAIGAHVAWGLLAPGGKLLLQWWPEWTLNAVRMSVATLVLMMVYGRRESLFALKALLVDKNLILLGVVGIGLTFSLYIASLNYIEATAAAVLIFLAPFITAVLARLTIREPMGWHLPVTAALMLLGAQLAIFGGQPATRVLLAEGVAFGLIVNLGSVFLWSIYTVHLRVVAPRYPLSRIMVATFTAASLFFIVGAFLFDDRPLEPAVAFQAVPLLHLGLYIAFPSILAYLLYSAAIARTGAGPITILLGVELIVASLLAHLLLDEAFPPWRVTGLVVSAIAVAWFVWKQNRFERRMRAEGRMPTTGRKDR